MMSTDNRLTPAKLAELALYLFGSIAAVTGAIDRSKASGYSTGVSAEMRLQCSKDVSRHSVTWNELSRCIDSQ